MNPTMHSGTALITGASSGIGALYAEQLAQRGHDLVLVARNRDKLETLAAGIRGKTGRTVELLLADLAQRQDLARVEEVLRTNPAISMLVNNAGVGAHGSVLEADVAAMQAMIDLNVTALMRLAYAAAPGFAARGQGAIINIASIVAVAPTLLNGVYGASKAFVLAFTETLQHELGDKGVRVQAVLPGATATDFWGVAGLAIEQLPGSIVMSARDMVAASLAGFDQGETVTIPSLPELEDWRRFEAARQALGPNLSHSQPAARYGVK